MSGVTFSDAALAEMNAYAPRFLPQAHVIKNLYDADTKVEYDLTKDVSSYGDVYLPSTMVQMDWIMPSMTIIVNDIDDVMEPDRGVVGGLYNKHASGSIWNQSPALHPKQCILRVRLYLWLPDTKERELALQYYGTIIDAQVRDDQQFSSVEIITTLEQNTRLKDLMPKLQSGSSVLYPQGRW